MRNHFYFRSSIAVLLVLGMCAALTAREGFAPGNHTLAKPYMTNALISFQPIHEYARYELTVRGPDGIYFRQDFNGLSMPYIEAYDLEGNALVDGQYAFELKAIPLLSQAAKGALKAARESNDYSVVQAMRASGELPKVVPTQSGYFRIHNGFIVLPGEERALAATIARATDGRDPDARPGTPTGGGDEGGSGDPKTGGDGDVTRDQVILDDLIVDGSICAGLDCVNGESFGFDTLRLKENNLRIKFQDTSTTASFPSNDWQITANDSSNGGANKFSIDDIDGGRTPFTIEASAPSHSLFVDDGGRIGLGTSTPVVELHVVDGDSPTLRLEQDGSSGFTPQTWDVAGNETNFFVRDATNGSRLPFKIRPSAPTNSIFVDSDGDVGLGTASPDARLHVPAQVLIDNGDNGAIVAPSNNDGLSELYVRSDDSGSDHIIATFENNSGGSAVIQLAKTGGSPTNQWELAATASSFTISRGGGAVQFIMDNSGNIDVDGDVTANSVLLTSDRNLKQGFEGIDPMDVLSKVVAMPLTTWSFKETSDVRHMGPMAQDFHAAFGLGPDDRHISPMDSAGVAIGAIQGLHQVISEKDAEISALNDKLKAQEERLRKLEELLLK